MKRLVRLYPSSWRKRYGAELEALADDVGPGIAGSLDLVLGAAAAYAAVVRGNRVLAAAGAFLHGLSVAVLVQAIVFVSILLVATRSASATISIGPFPIINVAFLGNLLAQHELAPSTVLALVGPPGLMPYAAVLAVLAFALGVVLAAPGLVRRLKP